MRGGPFYQRASWGSADDGSEQPRIRLARTWGKTTQLTRTRHDKARGRARAAQSLHTELQKNLSVFRRRDRHRSHRVLRARDHHDHGFGLHHRRADNSPSPRSKPRWGRPLDLFAVQISPADETVTQASGLV